MVNQWLVIVRCRLTFLKWHDLSIVFLYDRFDLKGEKFLFKLKLKKYKCLFSYLQKKTHILICVSIQFGLQKSVNC